MIDFLLKNILSFHEQLDAGKGIRDIGLIESAVNHGSKDDCTVVLMETCGL